MTDARVEIGMCFDRTFPAPLVVDVARRLEAGGADQLWVIEDCFYTAGVSLAAAATAVTERLRIGLGILPAVARNPAITAMELATLAALGRGPSPGGEAPGPNRLLAGIGHGVQDWMAQMGARTPSPLTTLEEVITAVRRLLAGERLTMHGRHVHLDDVELDPPPPPDQVPPVLAGVRGPRSLAMAGRAADGVVLAEPASPAYVRAALARAGHPPGFHVAVFAKLHVAADRTTAYQRMAPWLAGQLGDPGPALQALPFLDDLVTRHRDKGIDGLATMPPDWWTAIAPIGTLDDARAHIDALRDAGAHSVGLFPEPDLAVAQAQLDHVLALTPRG